MISWFREKEYERDVKYKTEQNEEQNEDNIIKTKRYNKRKISCKVILKLSYHCNAPL